MGDDPYPNMVKDMGLTKGDLLQLTASFGAGQALGPLLGALFYQMSDFRMTMNILAAITCTYAFIYIACAKGCDAFH